MSKKGREGKPYPINLIPLVFRCVDCKNTIRRLEETSSYVVLSISKEVSQGEIEPCLFCKRLMNYQGLT